MGEEDSDPLVILPPPDLLEIIPPDTVEIIDFRESINETETYSNIAEGELGKHKMFDVHENIWAAVDRAVSSIPSVYSEPYLHHLASTFLVIRRQENYVMDVTNYQGRDQ